LPPRKHTKTDTSVAEKEPRGQTSAEALARAALANVDANRPAPNDAPIEPGLADTRTAPLDIPVDIQPRRADVPPRQADVGPLPPIAILPRAPAIEAAPHPLDVQSPPVVQSNPVAPVDIGRLSASTRRRVPAKSRVRPCRSGHRRLKLNRDFPN
jgi:hypothetical protein